MPVARAVAVAFHLHHAPDRHARDAHVGGLCQKRRLGEVRLHLVALRLQRRAAAERDPQVKEHGKAAEDEQRHGDRLPGSERLLDHPAPPPQTSLRFGTPSSCTSVARVGLRVGDASVAVPLALGSWVGVVIATLLSIVGYAYRVRVEERALTSTLGDAYRAYAASTKRFIPFVI